MTIGVFTFDVHLPGSRSLKDRRQVMRRLKDRLRARYNVAVAEVEAHAELWQRGGLVVTSLASHREPLERLFEAVRREAEAIVPGPILETGIDFIDADLSRSGSLEDGID